MSSDLYSAQSTPIKHRYPGTSMEEKVANVMSNVEQRRLSQVSQLRLDSPMMQVDPEDPPHSEPMFSTPIQPARGSVQLSPPNTGERGVLADILGNVDEKKEACRNEILSAAKIMKSDPPQALRLLFACRGGVNVKAMLEIGYEHLLMSRQLRSQRNKYWRLSQLKDYWKRRSSDYEDRLRRARKKIRQEHEYYKGAGLFSLPPTPQFVLSNPKGFKAKLWRKRYG